MPAPTDTRALAEGERAHVGRELVFDLLTLRIREEVEQLAVIAAKLAAAAVGPDEARAAKPSWTTAHEGRRDGPFRPC